METVVPRRAGILKVNKINSAIVTSTDERFVVSKGKGGERASIACNSLLETRLRLTHAWSGRLEASLIQRPVFITGMPRSGSTFLHELLVQDPDNRAPRVWEIMFPLPTKSTWPNAP